MFALFTMTTEARTEAHIPGRVRRAQAEPEPI